MLPEKEEELISLAEAAKRLGFTELYVRTLVRKRKLTTKKVPIGPESQVWKHMLKASEVEALKTGKVASKASVTSARGTHHNHRKDGRRKYSLYANAQEADAIKEFLTLSQFAEVLESLQTTSQIGVYRIRKAKKIEKLRSEVKR